MRQNICIYGVGGVGGYIGGKIANAISMRQNEFSLYFIARGAHLEEIKRNGLLLNTHGEAITIEPTLATEDPGELPDIDVCFICVKSYDLINAISSIKPRLKKDSIVVAPLNGIDIYDRIRVVLDEGTILPSAIIIGAYIEKPGTVTHNGGGRFVIGADPGNKEFDIKPVIDLLKLAGIDYIYLEDANTEIWTKFIFIAPFALVCSCYDKTLGEVMESDELKTKVVDVMKEIAFIAAKKGITLDENIISISLEKANSFPYETKTSLHRDILAGKPNELDLFGGSIEAMGRELNIPTPATKMLCMKINDG